MCYGCDRASRAMTSRQAVTYVAMVTAVENDDAEAVKQLLQTGADVNACLDDDIGRSPCLLYNL